MIPNILDIIKIIRLMGLESILKEMFYMKVNLKIIILAVMEYFIMMMKCPMKGIGQIIGKNHMV